MRRSAGAARAPFATAEALLAEVRRRIAMAADPARAAGQRNFFREKVNPAGVHSSALKPIEAFVYRTVKKWPAAKRNRLCDGLWKGTLEEGAIVCHVYRRFKSQFGASEFRLFERWLDRYVHNWAHCDGLASWLLAGCIENEPGLTRQLNAWTRSRNRWKRRAAAVSLLQEGKKGRNTEAVFRICSLLRNDADDMVQKGIGWLLKETYPKRPAAVVRFLTPWRATAPRLLIRYAAEKMNARDRAFVMS